MNTTPNLPSLQTRASLLSRLQDGGDVDAWEIFADRYGKLVRDFARQAGVAEEDTRDIAQEVMLGFSKQAAEFRYDPSKGRFKTWLLTLARRRIADHWRKNASRRSHEAVAEELKDQPSESDLERLWDKEWQDFLIEQAMERVKQRVSNRQFLLWDLAVRQDMPPADICKTMNSNAAAVYLAKHRVSKMLAKEIKLVMEEAELPTSVRVNSSQ